MFRQVKPTPSIKQYWYAVSYLRNSKYFYNKSYLFAFVLVQGHLEATPPVTVTCYYIEESTVESCSNSKDSPSFETSKQKARRLPLLSPKQLIKQLPEAKSFDTTSDLFSHKVLILNNYFSHEEELRLLKDIEENGKHEGFIVVSPKQKASLMSIINGYDSFPSSTGEISQLHECIFNVENKDVGMHRDIDVESGVVSPTSLVYYLKGSGVFTLSDGIEERHIDIVPGRLIMWSNKHFFHTVKGDSSHRYMLGPLSIGTEKEKKKEKKKT